MPRYSKSQLDGFVADRRYWDKKHPEHQAHLDFTVKAFEETYPDPVAPTQEQEEWAAAEEKRLREMAKLRPFWDSRDPGHATARAEFYRGFDKINSVLYGTPASDGDAPAASKTDARDPLDPVMPSIARPPRTVPTTFGGTANMLEPTMPTQPRAAKQLRTSNSFHGGDLPSEANAISRARKSSSPLAEPMAQATENTQQAMSPFWLRPPAPQQAPREPVPMPPRVIHPDIKLPDGWNSDLYFSPLQVNPEQIEELWKQLDDPETAFERFKEYWKNGTGLDPATGQLRTLTEQELRNSFERDQDLIKKFLWDYYYKRDEVLPNERERVNPDGPSRDKDEYNPDNRDLA